MSKAVAVGVATSCRGTATAKRRSIDAFRRHLSPRSDAALRIAPHGSQLRQRRIPHTSRRRSAEAPAHPRQSPQSESRKTRSRRNPPPIHAQPGSAKTGLSRRKPRVRVPSLPKRSLQISISCPSPRRRDQLRVLLFSHHPTHCRRVRLGCLAPPSEDAAAGQALGRPPKPPTAGARTPSGNAR